MTGSGSKSRLRADPGALAELAKDLRAPSVLLVVDQAEELVTQAEQERLDFLRMLMGALGNGSPLFVLLTLRSDYLTATLRDSPVAELVGSSGFLVAPLAHERLAEVISRPAGRAGLVIEPGLVEQMAVDTNTGDALPLLAFALREISDGLGVGETITWDRYAAVGGVVGALQRKADEVAEALAGAGHGRAVLPTLTKMVTFNGRSEPIRRPVAVGSLTETERQVADAFVAARLLTTRAEESGAPVVEVTHEALFTAWSPLRQAIDERRDALGIGLQLESAARAWLDSDRLDSYLFAGERLAFAQHWLQIYSDLADDLPLLNNFVKASARRDRATVRRESDILANRLLSDPPEDSELHILLALAAIEQYAPTVRSVRALHEALAASRLRECLSGHEDACTSCAYSADGTQILTASEDGTARVWDAATGTELLALRHPSAVTDAAFSVDGSRILTASREGGTIIVWDRATGEEQLALHHRSVNTAAFSPDGSRIVTAGGRAAQVWDAGTGAGLMPLSQRMPLSKRWYEPRSAVFSPDGSTIVTSAWRGWLLIWDAASGTISRRLRGTMGTEAAVSPDGRRIVAIDGKDAQVWDLHRRGQQSVLTLKGHNEDVRSAVDLASAAFSPDGSIIMTAGRDRTVRLRDSGDGREVLMLRLQQTVNRARFSPSGSNILTADNDGRARVWDLPNRTELAVIGPLQDLNNAVWPRDAGCVVTWQRGKASGRIWDITGRARGTLAGRKQRISHAAAAPDGVRVAAASEDGTTRLWSCDDGRELLVLRGHDSDVVHVSFSADGRLVMTASRDRTIRVWDAAEGTQLIVIPVGDKAIRQATFGPDDRRILALLAASSNDPSPNASTVGVYDAATGANLFELDKHKDALRTAAFSPDGSKIVTASWDGTARIWEGGSGRPVTVLEHGHRVESATFSPDSQSVATTCQFNSAVRLWNAADGGQTTIFQHQEDVESPAFSPDGRLLAVPSTGGTVYVWDIAEAFEVMVLRGHDRPVIDCTFSADGRLLLTRADDNTVRIWENPPLDELIAKGHRRAFRSLTDSERREFGLPSEEQRT